jgi:hypothetical protein
VVLLPPVFKTYQAWQNLPGLILTRKAMGLFDFFRKKETGPHYDPGNIKITDLRKGFVFEYNLKNWVVKEEYEYDWGDGYFSREYKIDAGDEELFLHLEQDDELEITLTKKVKVLTVDENLPEYVTEHRRPPKTLHYEGKKFFLDGENPGYFRDPTREGSQWVEMISWDYYDENDEYLLNIEQWGEREFEAAYGKMVKDYEFSNILPS